MPESRIVEGELVTLMGAGQLMLVRSIGGDTAYCLWFEGTCLRTGTFLLTRLQSVTAARRVWAEAAAEEDVAAFRTVLRDQGLHAALAFLNGRTPHRFTAVYRYDGDMLRNVAIFDRWQPEVTRGDDVPLNQAYCSVIKSSGLALEVQDGRTDPRFPALATSPVASYCGVPIARPDGGLFGALCHWDLARCEVRSVEIPMLFAAAPMILEWLSGPGGLTSVPKAEPEDTEVGA